ncbi:MAG: HD domain-containing protein [Treponema sp.]|nr:HD domain-containing protein [Treponema sp.]
MKSPKELNIDNKLIEKLEELNLCGYAMTGLKLLLESKEIQSLQEYANTVSIVRLGFNDHGPVHMRTVTKTAVIMMDLLRKAGIKTTLETDGCGDFEDSLLAVIFSAMLHDIGMSIGRQNHESHSMILAYPIIDKILDQIFHDNFKKKLIIRSVALEGIAGHMGTLSLTTLEAGIIQVADGCDMTKGRARIPIAMGHSPRVGHIHQYSANSIEKVKVVSGSEKPIRIDINMSSETGLFQVEEVLMHKISASTAKQYIELYANVRDEETRRYL